MSALHRAWRDETPLPPSGEAANDEPVERLSRRLGDVQQGWQAFDELWRATKPWLVAGHRLVLEVRPETRSDAQNRLLHSRIQDIAHQLEWAGQRWSTEDWKRLLTAGWCRTRNQGAMVVPAIDGHGLEVLYQRTSKLSRAECAELADYIMAWGDERDVHWRPASLGPGWVDPSTGEIAC